MFFFGVHQSQKDIINAKRRKTVIKFRQWVLDYLCTENENNSRLGRILTHQCIYADQREQSIIIPQCS